MPPRRPSRATQPATGQQRRARPQFQARKARDQGPVPLQQEGGRQRQQHHDRPHYALGQKVAPSASQNQGIQRPR